MSRFAVIGNPIAHSLSPAIHHFFAEQTGVSLCYEKVFVPIEDFENYVLNFFEEGGKGLNITLPFKERAFALSKIHTSRCAMAEAANTLWQKDGVIYADNTDGIGLIRDLSKHLDLSNQSILLLGAGGAIKAILPSLFMTNPKSIVLTNRTIEKAYPLRSKYPKLQIETLEGLTHQFDIIINATSSGYSQETPSLPPSLFDNKPICYDLSYDLKALTPFTKLAQSHNCQAIDGIGMLIEQAAESFYIWHGIRTYVDEHVLRAMT